MSSQASGAQRRLCWMQRRLRRKSGRRQPKHWAVLRKHIVDGPKGVASGARARQSIALQVFRWALPRRSRMGRPPSFQMVGSARRSGPKIQARSGVSAGCKGGSRRKSGRRRSIALQVFRVALPRCPLRSKWRDGLCLARTLLAAPFGPSSMCFLGTPRCLGCVVPSLRRAAPSARNGRIPEEGVSSLCAARLRLGKTPQICDVTAVIPPSLDWHCRAIPSFFEKIITLFQRIFDMLRSVAIHSRWDFLTTNRTNFHE